MSDAAPDDADGQRPEDRRGHGPLIGAVLCGGRSRRFGSDKALAPAGDQLMGSLVVDAIREAGVDPVVAVGGTAGSDLGLVTVPDRWPGEGPLAGLATILWWARTGDVLVVPCDIPLLSAEVVGALVSARDELRSNGRHDAVVAAVNGEPQHSLVIWPADRHRSIRRMLDSGERRFRAALTVIPSVMVEVPGAALVDVDTPDELAELLDRS